jgi:GTP-binding protein SAR1
VRSHSPSVVLSLQELQIAGVNFKAFDLGGHEIARKVWKDYYAKVGLGRSVTAGLCAGS